MKTIVQGNFSIMKVSMLVMLIVLFSCKKEKTINFRDPLSAECLLNVIANNNDTTIFFYNNQKQVERIEWKNTGYMDITYDTDGRIIHSDEFYSGINEYYTDYTWDNLQVEAIYYRLDEGQWTGKYKKTIEYNNSKEIIKITGYTLDALGENWIEDGDYYLFEWIQGNLIKMENWDNYSFAGKKKNITLTQKLMSPFCPAKLVYRNIKSIRNNNDDFNLYSTTSFEYDTKINPLRYVTSAIVLSPDEFNISKNNCISSTYTDINSQEILSGYDYVFNDKNFPVNINIVEQHVYVNGTITTNSSKTYGYECK